MSSIRLVYRAAPLPQPSVSPATLPGEESRCWTGLEKLCTGIATPTSPGTFPDKRPAQFFSPAPLQGDFFVNCRARAFLDSEGAARLRCRGTLVASTTRSSRARHRRRLRSLRRRPRSHRRRLRSHRRRLRHRRTDHPPKAPPKAPQSPPKAPPKSALARVLEGGPPPVVFPTGQSFRDVEFSAAPRQGSREGSREGSPAKAPQPPGPQVMLTLPEG
jgi:hypothetical protein